MEKQSLKPCSCVKSLLKKLLGKWTLEEDDLSRQGKTLGKATGSPSQGKVHLSFCERLFSYVGCQKQKLSGTFW